MVQVKIKINIINEDIIISSTEDKSIIIYKDSNELKASDVIDFLRYENDKEYIVEEIDEKLKDNKNIMYVYELFKIIIDKLNLLNE